jgi:GAF domain-containing protein
MRADRVEALEAGDHRRLGVLVGDALAAAPDADLQALVAEAARETEAAFSALALVLAHTTLFRAHNGLPSELALTASIPTSATLCQLVVRDGAPFELEDLARVPDMPQALLRDHGVRAYLGVPVAVGGVIVGSLAIYDTKPRTFGDDSRARLVGVAQRASHRLSQLARRRGPLDILVARALRPAFAEVRGSLAPLDTRVAEASSLITPIANGDELAVERMERALAGMREELARIRESMVAIECATNYGGAGVHVEDVVRSADRLAFHDTKLIGGVRWNIAEPGARLDMSAVASITVVSTGLSTLAVRMRGRDVREGIDARVLRDVGSVAFCFEGDAPQAVFDDAAAYVSDLSFDAGVRISTRERQLAIALPAS